MERSISPPPKRRKLSRSEATHITNPSNQITIYSWNVNGIQPFLQKPITSYFGTQQHAKDDGNTPRASLRDFLKRHDWPALLFLQEIKISPDDPATVRALEKAVKRDDKAEPEEPDYSAHVCLPSDKFNARGFGRKVYGVCSIVRKDFAETYVERIRPVNWDQEGRFLVIETKACSSRPRLALINAYMVNGTDNAYKNPSTGEKAGTRHDRKLEVHRLLAAECRDLEARGFAVVLVGDINIARAPIDGFPNLRTFPQRHCTNRADFERRFLHKRRPSSTSNEPSNDDDDDERASSKSTANRDDSDENVALVDTFRHLHPEKKGYTYYPRGKTFGESCDRVDMILVSSLLQAALVGAGMHETPGERGPSDHVPLYARLGFADENAKVSAVA